MPSTRDLAAIAAIVGCDVRTVRSYFKGRRTLPIYAQAIERAWALARTGAPRTADLLRDVGPSVRRTA